MATKRGLRLDSVQGKIATVDTNNYLLPAYAGNEAFLRSFYPNEIQAFASASDSNIFASGFPNSVMIEIEFVPAAGCPSVLEVQAKQATSNTTFNDPFIWVKAKVGKTQRVVLSGALFFVSPSGSNYFDSWTGESVSTPDVSRAISLQWRVPGGSSLFTSNNPFFDNFKGFFSSYRVRFFTE